MKTTCFVTGGSGFIGQHLLASLTRQGHKVHVLMRQPGHLADLRATVQSLGGDGALLAALEGDLGKPRLGLGEQDRQALQGVRVVFHLGVQFAWGLSYEQARAINVHGALQVADLALELGARLLMVGGYMLENTAHLQRIGVDLARPMATDWRTLYRKVGGYEGSKLHAHFAVRQRFVERAGEMTVIHPATVCGHSRSGQILAGQPLADLIDNLAAGRLSALPGTPEHWLPLVCVDFLAELMVAAAFDPEQAGRDILVLDARTPNLAGMVGILAEALGRRAPTRHVPIALLRTLLKIPGLPRLLHTSAESLDFIQAQRFDTQPAEVLAHAYGLEWPDIRQALHATAIYVGQGAARR